MNTKPWTPSDISNATGIGPLEFQDNLGRFHSFEVLATEERLVFGSFTNSCFLESGYIERQESETMDDTLQEMFADLEVYYNDGKQYVARIICNERM